MYNDVAIEVKNVSKTIKGSKIIRGISFKVKKGEIFGLIGPNGAGKTTIMRMMVGLSSINEGEIIICRNSVTMNKKEALKSIGAIIETPQMYQYMSGYQNLKIFASLHKIKSAERIKDVVQVVGLSKSINDKVSKYSLGMIQRLGIAQALLHEPKVLILDEPTNGLDPSGIKELRSYLRKIADQKKVTIIISSHLISEIELTCDRIGIIKNGELISIDSNEEQKDTKSTYTLKLSRPEIAYQSLSSLGIQILEIREDYIRLSCHQQEMPSIIKELVEKNVDIYYVNQVKSHLEDRYMQITK